MGCGHLRERIVAGCSRCKGPVAGSELRGKWWRWGPAGQCRFHKDFSFPGREGCSQRSVYPPVEADPHVVPMCAWPVSSAGASPLLRIRPEFEAGHVWHLLQRKVPKGLRHQSLLPHQLLTGWQSSEPSPSEQLPRGCCEVDMLSDPPRLPGVFTHLAFDAPLYCGLSHRVSSRPELELLVFVRGWLTASLLRVAAPGRSAPSPPSCRRPDHRLHGHLWPFAAAFPSAQPPHLINSMTHTCSTEACLPQCPPSAWWG